MKCSHCDSSAETLASEKLQHPITIHVECGHVVVQPSFAPMTPEQVRAWLIEFIAYHAARDPMWRELCARVIEVNNLTEQELQVVLQRAQEQKESKPPAFNDESIDKIFQEPTNLETRPVKPLPLPNSVSFKHLSALRTRILGLSTNTTADSQELRQELSKITVEMEQVLLQLQKDLLGPKLTSQPVPKPLQQTNFEQERFRTAQPIQPSKFDDPHRVDWKSNGK